MTLWDLRQSIEQAITLKTYGLILLALGVVLAGIYFYPPRGPK